jgi:type I restriction enzyme S subunit
VWTSLDAIAAVQSGAAKSKRLIGADDCVELPYLSVANVQRGYLDLGEVGTMWVKKSKVADLTLQPGDVLFNEGGDKDKLGRGWVWEGEIDGCVHQNHVFRARLRGDGIDPRWLSYWGNTFGRWWFHDRGSQTTGIASINKTVLRSLPIPIPPPDEQVTMIAALERYSSGITHARNSIDTINDKLRVLRRSVLRAAFEGRLRDEEAPARSIVDAMQ